MSKQNGKPIRSALRDQQHRLSEHAYPGDLADETLQKFNAPSRLRSLRYPALAAAMIGIGLTLAITLLPRNKDTSAPGPVVSIQPAPETTTQQPPAVAQTPTGPEPITPAKVAAAPLPEIDRGLLPVSRNSKATWLASPRPHLTQTERHTRLAANPNPGKRLRVTFSAPTRSSIDRSLSRTLTLKPNAKPRRSF